MAPSVIFLPGFIGSTGKYSTSKLTKSIAFYNSNFAGKLTPAGSIWSGAGLFTGAGTGGSRRLLSAHCQRHSGYQGAGLPGHYAEATWLKTIDLRLNWPLHVGERLMIEPSVSLFNVFNFANFGGPGNQLSGMLNGAPGTSLNNASSAGFCGNSTALQFAPGSDSGRVPAPTPTARPGRWSSG